MTTTQSNKTVTIMRGLPGSGKSRRAHRICAESAVPVVIVSADHYFETDDGEYNFRPAEIARAHAYCLHRFVSALRNQVPHIIVDNTNVQHWEFYNYEAIALLAGYDVNVIEVPCTGAADVELFAARNVHGVPLAVVQAMHDRWEA